jgi:formamidopyrimidine-DNA glycosylase
VPELPDVTVYVEAIEKRFSGRVLAGMRLSSPFVLRTVDPPPAALAGAVLRTVERLGKRIVLGFAAGDDVSYFAVIHLMVAGRLHARETVAKLDRRRTLLSMDFLGPTESLVLTEAGTKKRASLHLARGRAGLEEHRREGIDVFGATTEQFGSAMRAENHTLKRSLTDPHILDGIGNAYSDEILLRAKLSPVAVTSKLSDDEFARLHAACKEVLAEWIERLREDAGDDFPEQVTAFRPEMGAHGKYGQPCPQCATPIQRIVHATRETNYCPTCQTGGKLLADRGLSRLLKRDWPRTLEELEAHRSRRRS